MGRRFRGWGGGSPSQLQGAQEENGKDGEKGPVCVNMGKKEEVTATTLRKNLKKRILRLSECELDELLKAIESGKFCSIQSDR